MPKADNVGTEIHYEVVGDGPPLVLQHGRLGSGRFWHDFSYVSALADHHTLLLVDARGHGRSDKPHTPDAYYARDMASDVVAVLDDIAIEMTDFFGYSMGGRIGFACATFFPERFNSLILGGAGMSGPAVSPEAELRLAESLESGMEGYVTAMEHMLHRTIPDDDRAALLNNDADALAALARCTATWTDMTEPVAAANIPTLLFGGAIDPIWPLIEQASNALAWADVRCLDGLGHGEDLRQPTLILPLVTEFLARNGLGADQGGSTSPEASDQR